MTPIFPRYPWLGLSISLTIIAIAAVQAIKAAVVV